MDNSFPPNITINVQEEWFTNNLEAKLNKKIDDLQILVHQQFGLIQTLYEEIRQLKGVVTSIQDATTVGIDTQQLSEEIKTLKDKSASQNDRTHALLEELKVLKQRELNMMLREKRPTPFVAMNPLISLPNPFLVNELSSITGKIISNSINNTISKNMSSTPKDSVTL